MFVGNNNALVRFDLTILCPPLWGLPKAVTICNYLAKVHSVKSNLRKGPLYTFEMTEIISR